MTAVTLRMNGECNVMLNAEENGISFIGQVCACRTRNETRACLWSHYFVQSKNKTEEKVIE